MKRKIRILATWILVSLVLQFSIYSYLESRVAKVLAPPTGNTAPIVKELKATVPGNNLENLQLSYAKDYLAYTENGALKVFNLSSQKVVFEKRPVPGSDKNMGLLHYQWLPDRNTLIYFFAKKNPNPVTTVVVQPSTQPAQQQSKPQNNQPQSTTPNPAVEDPNQAPKQQQPVQNTPKSNTNQTVPQAEASPQPIVEKRYGNPQLTELFTLELPDSNENTLPDDRFNRSLDSFPAGGEIQQMVVSTFTNLIYLTVKTNSGLQLMEIDVMKNVRNLHRSGETITNMAASDKYGTLYVESKVGNAKHILALENWKREIVSKNSNDIILGDRSGKLYAGEIKDDKITLIKTLSDTNENDRKFEFKTKWEGSIPFKNSRIIIGAGGEVIVYDTKVAYIVKNGKLKELTLKGEENYISSDGAEIMEINRDGKSTLIELRPLK